MASTVSVKELAGKKLPGALDRLSFFHATCQNHKPRRSDLCQILRVYALLLGSPKKRDWHQQGGETNCCGWRILFWKSHRSHASGWNPGIFHLKFRKPFWTALTNPPHPLLPRSRVLMKGLVTQALLTGHFLQHQMFVKAEGSCSSSRRTTAFPSIFFSSSFPYSWLC